MARSRPAGLPGFKTIRDVMDETGFCRLTVDRMVRDGRLPAKRMGRLILIPEAALANLAASLPDAF